MIAELNYNWVVVGSQFSAAIGAYLAKQNSARVALLDQNTNLCSSMRGKQWGGFQLDFGCQMFSSYGSGKDDPIYAILDGDVVWLQRRLASVIQGQLTQGFEFPDLSAYGPDTSGRILTELVETATHEAGPPASMAEALHQRYGPTAAALISKLTRETYGLDTRSLAPEAYEMLPFRRLVLTSDAVARMLKTIGKLDDRIAARDIISTRTATQGPVYYPAKGGMATFCDRAEQQLRAMKVSMMLGRKINQLQLEGDAIKVSLDNGKVLRTNHILWATNPDQLSGFLDFPQKVSEQISSVPLIAYYFDIGTEQAGPYTYVQSFDEQEVFFRGSVPGSYGTDTCPPGRSYACGEILTSLTSDVWKDPSAYTSRVWREMLNRGVVTGSSFRDSHIISTPVSYSFPKIGYASALDQLQRRLESFPNIHLIGRPRSGRHETVETIRNLLAASQ